MATRSNWSSAWALISSTSMSRMRHMATFSGRVMVPKVQIGAEVRLRPSSVLSASAEAMASGSGSSCIRIRIRSAPSKCARMRSTRGPLDGALDGGLDHVLAERGQGDGYRPGRRAVLIAHHEHRRVRDGFGDGGHDARELSRPCAHDQRSASDPQRLTVDGRVRRVPGDGAISASRDATASSHRIHHVDGPLSWKCRAAQEVLEKIGRADHDGPHAGAPVSHSAIASVATRP